MEVLRQVLLQEVHIEGVFWDYASLFQNPPGGQRTEEEQGAFRRSLDVMTDLYASAVGTTVLQIEEMPPCPAEFKGDYNTVQSLFCVMSFFLGRRKTATHLIVQRTF